MGEGEVLYEGGWDQGGCERCVCGGVFSIVPPRLITVQGHDLASASILPTVFCSAVFRQRLGGAARHPTSASLHTLPHLCPPSLPRRPDHG